MNSKFIEKSINIKDIPSEYPMSSCLIENNEKQIGQVCDFLMNDKKLLLVNGFRGSGKSQVVKLATDSLTPETILLRYNCLETTILDDMLLSFFESFRYYHLMGKISPPKIKVDNFAQKINSYFHSISAPILVVLDSFDAIVKENKSDIVNFVQHLLSFQNVKVILIAKTFSNYDFSDIEFDKVTTLAFSQKIFEKFLKDNGIKQIGVLSNELYKLSKGYYNYLLLTVNIMNLRQLTLVNFLELYSKSYMAFPEFIIREALSLVDPISAHLFRLLTVMRIPIHFNLIKSLHLYDESRIMFFVQNSILSVEGECLYLKDIFREVLENQIPENVMIKLHSACIDLYNTQLPLKPLERDLKLSRQTMRNEIEYHSMFIPKKPVINPKVVQPMLVEPSILPVEQKAPQVEDVVKPEIEETKEEKINKISFIIDDSAILDNIADSIKDFVSTTSQDNMLEKESSGMSLKQLLNAAKKEEQSYNYKRVVMLYQNALTKTSDDDFYTFLPVIYTKLAQAYQKLSDWYEALEYYTQAQDFYVNASNQEKVYETKLAIANIYYLMYKHDNAKFILSELEKAQDLPNELAIRVNLACAKLANDLHSEYKYYKKSLPLVELGTDKSVVSELYYKYAVTSDELDDPRTAAEFYKKCISLDSNPKHNRYLSKALANIAELYDEAGSTKAAVKYYNESIKIDTVMKNYGGLYGSAIHLAEIFLSVSDEKSLEYLFKALEYAKLLKEAFYIAGASLEIGDFYFRRRDNEHAYKYFMEAYKVAEKSFTKDNIEKIVIRLNDVKRRVTEQELVKYQEKYGK